MPIASFSWSGSAQHGKVVIPLLATEMIVARCLWICVGENHVGGRE
jgi:hypothetical protein